MNFGGFKSGDTATNHSKSARVSLTVKIFVPTVTSRSNFKIKVSIVAAALVKQLFVPPVLQTTGSQSF
jgi:hypothetical protein